MCSQILENRASASDEDNYLKLKRLFSINNNLLRVLGVSHPVLEEIFSISERYGFGAKLTGAGAGGSVAFLILIFNSLIIHKITSQLISKQISLNFHILFTDSL